MHAMLLAGLLLLGVRGTAGYRASEGDFMVQESLAQRRQLFRQLGVVGKTRLKDAKCETEVQGGVPVVVMLSGTGEGKSTVTCVLSGNPALAHVAAEDWAHSETSKSCIHKASWFFPYDHSEPLYLVDTPGVGRTRGDFSKFFNADIVNTMKRAGRAHAILWVLNSADPKMSQGRQDTFRFVRSYFGKEIYKHIVFVYTRFSWDKARGRGKRERGEVREKALMERHRKTMSDLLEVLETEFWPGGIVDRGVNDTIMQLPCFALNTHAVKMEEDDGGGMVFYDDDISDDDLNEDDPDGSFGVFNPETFGKDVTPNSATQLRDLKAKILEISQEPPLDLTNLRPYQDGCKAALKDTMKTDPVVFGQHVTDCVEGQQYKLLKDEVAPYVNGLQDGPVFAAFCINAYTVGRGPVGSALRVEAMRELGIPDADRENAEAFASYDAYVSCRDAKPGQINEVAVLVKSLSTCLGGVDTGHGTPALVEAMRQRFFGEAAKSSMSSPAYIDKVVAEIGKLPEHESATVWKHMDFTSLMSRWVEKIPWAPRF